MSKYQRWYDQIVERAKLRAISHDYTEWHHIQPRAFGGSDDLSNLVELTYREHFLVHWLLTKVTVGPQRRQMLLALHCMSFQIGGRAIKWWQVEIVKRAMRDQYIAARELRLALKAEARNQAIVRKRINLLASQRLAIAEVAAIKSSRKDVSRAALTEAAAKIIAGRSGVLRRLTPNAPSHREWLGQLKLNRLERRKRRRQRKRAAPSVEIASSGLDQ